MVSVQDVLRNVKKWFETGSEESNDIVDVPWDVSVDVDEEGNIKFIEAVNPRFPVKFYAHPIGDRFVRIAVEAGLETAALDTVERLSIYRRVLHFNSRIPLMKFMLMPPDDDLILAVDLDVASLSEEEFNDALRALFVGLTLMAQQLELREELAKRGYENLIRMLAERVEKGWSQAELYRFLTKRAGLEPKEAEILLSRVLSLLRKERGTVTIM